MSCGMIEVDDVVLEFMINYRQPFFLYGKNKNLAVRTISAKTNVRIYFPEFDSKKQNFRDAEHFTLEGSFENVQRCGAFRKLFAFLRVI